MNVTVENLAACKKLLRVELDAEAVNAAFDAIAKDYQKQAALPGFRPGKAPRELVIKKYETEIKDEAKRKLIGDAYRKALQEQKISAVGYPDVEEFTAATETLTFSLPKELRRDLRPASR